MVRLFIGLLLTAVWFAGTALALEPDTKPIWQKRVWGQDGKPTYSPLVPKDAGAELPLVFPGRGEFVIGTPKGLLPANADMIVLSINIRQPTNNVFRRPWRSLNRPTNGLNAYIPAICKEMMYALTVS